MANQILTQDLAEKFAQDKKYLDNLLYVRQIDTFLLYNEAKGYYDILTEDQMENIVIEHTKRCGKSLSHSLIKDIIYFVKHYVYLKIDELPHNYIALHDKLLNLSTFQLEDFDRNKYAYHSIDCSSDKLSMETPVFNSFLRSICVTEEGKFDASLFILIQEMFGFYLLQEIKPHAVFFLIGEGRNGKSVLINILLHLIGKKFSMSLSLQTLTTDKFAIPDLIGKRLNICTEEESKYIQSDKFKSLVAGDPVEGERKYGNHFVFYPRVKFIFAANHLPSFDKIDDALRGRMFLLYFHRVFKPHEQNKNLFEQVLPELPGILEWAMKGAQRLRDKQNYDFTQTKNNLSTMYQFENNTSSAIMFIREQYTEDERSFITNQDLYFDYCHWCDINGRKKMNNTNFARDITKVLKTPTVLRRVFEKGNKVMRGRTLKHREDEV